MKFVDFSYKETLADIKSSPQYCTDKNYHEWMAKTTPWRGRRVAKILADYFSPQDKIIDVGCSQGLTFSYLAQSFKNIVGVDIDSKALITAKNRLTKLGLKNKLILYDGKRLPFKGGSVDGIVTTETFEHVNNRKAYIKELHRVLKTGGKIIISSPNKLYPIECEFHLPFLSYLPKKYADKYVQLSNKGKSYDGVNHPTYSQIKKILNKYFDTTDITFDLIKNHRKYYLSNERGTSIRYAAFIIEFMDKSFLKLLLSILKNFSAGWFFVCTKNK